MLGRDLGVAPGGGEVDGGAQRLLALDREAILVHRRSWESKILVGSTEIVAVACRGAKGYSHVLMRRVVVLTAVLFHALPAAAWAGIPFVHAHRGGSLTDGVPTLPENSLPAFERAAGDGVVIELDVKLSKDRVPVVIHDDLLDRTTNCMGTVGSKTLAELRDCRLDINGTDDKTTPIATPTERIPTLEEALDLLRRTGARANVEIKNLPTDSDYDPGTGYAEDILAVVKAAKLPSRQLIVQSFDFHNLQVSEAELPAVDTALLSLAPTNLGAAETAKANGFEYLSPEFGAGLAPGVVEKAHAAGLRVVPFTIDTPAGVKAAAAAGVDEIITNDPRMALRALAEAEPPAGEIPPPPSEAECGAARASRSLAPVEAYDGTGGASTPRVFAIQFKQDVRHVVTYATFRTKMECLVREWVVPRLAPGRPNVVALNEDVGLATIATGTRGRAARDAFTRKGGPSCESAGAPCTTVGALGAIRTGYSKEVTAYRGRFPSMSPVSDAFVATTDTFARGWMQTFSDIAKRYGVYILGSNNQAPFRESTDPSEIATFRDPDLPSAPASVYVATSDAVFNEVFLWGPREVRSEGPRPLRNVVAQNKKVPLTPIEEQLQLRNGPSTGPDAIDNVAPYSLPATGARISFATSLPAFVYGDPPAGTDPCSDTAKYYMRCLDKLGANLVMQDEANPGRWAGAGGGSPWQPLEWMSSTYRAVADPTVAFSYNVTPHLVGNLADLAFDGQTAITQRGLQGGASCRYVGNAVALPEDPEQFRGYAGGKPEFLGLLPWVAPDGPRDDLRSVAGKLAPGSGDPLENDYLEGAIAADLPFPPNPRRAGCAGAEPGVVTRPGGGGPGGGGGQAGPPQLPGIPPRGGNRGTSRRLPALRRLRVRARQRARTVRRRGLLVQVSVRRAARVKLRVGRATRTVRLRKAGVKSFRVRLRRGVSLRRSLTVTARAGSRTLRARPRLRR